MMEQVHNKENGETSKTKVLLGLRETIEALLGAPCAILNSKRNHHNSSLEKHNVFIANYVYAN